MSPRRTGRTNEVAVKLRYGGLGLRDSESHPETPLRRSPQRREAPGRWALAAARSTELRPRSHKVTQVGAGLGFKNPKWRSTVRLALLWPVGWLRAALPGFRFFRKVMCRMYSLRLGRLRASWGRVAAAKARRPETPQRSTDLIGSGELLRATCPVPMQRCKEPFMYPSF